MFHQIFDNTIGTGVRPIGLRKCVFIFIAGIHIIDHAPGIVHLRLPEAVAVIPLSYYLKIVLKTVIFQHLFHLVLRETKMFCKRIIGNRDNVQVIQPREDRLFADPQAPGHHCEFQIIIRLQRGLEERTDQRDHPVVESTEIRILKGDVILVDQDDGLLSSAGIQAVGKEFQ